MRFLVLVLLVSLARPVAAQRIPQSPFTAARIEAGTHRTPVTALDTAGIQETHWLAGAITGAVLLGVLGGFLATSWCSDNENSSCFAYTVEGALFGGFLGFGFGSLAGGQASKQ